MRHLNSHVLWVAGLAICLFPTGKLGADDGLKKPLDHSSYDQWKRISGTQISRDGKWLIYTLRPGKGDETLKIRELGSQREFVIERGTSARFTFDNRFALCLVRPDPKKVKAARKAKQAAEEQPQSSLLILDLNSGQSRSIARARYFTLPEKAGGWVAVSLAKPATVPAPSKTEAESRQVERIATQTSAKATTKTAGKKPAKKPEKKPAQSGARPKSEDSEENKKKKSPGTVLVLKNLETGMENRFPDVTSFQFSKDGRRLAWTTSIGPGQKSGSDGVSIIDLSSLRIRQLLSGPGHYRNLSFDESGDLLAFITDRDTYKEKRPQYTVYSGKSAAGVPKPIAAKDTEGIAKGWHIPESSSLRFSKNGRLLFFNTAPQRDRDEDEEKKSSDSDDEDEKPVKVDVWHWQDPWLQPMQLLRAEREKRRTYMASVQLANGRVCQLANPEMPSVQTGDEGNSRFALGLSDVPYRKLISWDYPGYNDVFLIDTLTGKAEKLLEMTAARPSWSPKSKFVTWWDAKERAWYGLSVLDRKPIKLSAKIPYPVHNELHDSPSPPRAYGTGGWTDGDQEVLIYDRFDVWAVDPRRPHQPRCITEGQGRRANVRFRCHRLDREARSLPPDAPLLLSAFNELDKSSGFFEDRITGDQHPRKLLMKDERVAYLGKAQDSDTVIFTRSTFRRFPDIWASSLSFREMKRISRANPQQLKYRWGTAELTQWKARDGRTLQGILYKPADFDPQQKYPLLVYFYERNSDNLHRYITPAPSRSSVNYSFYVSRGYVMFIPDIPYRTGYPGKSAEDAVLPGIQHLVKQGFINEKAIGVQGHSWGGYQIAHLVTRTKMFAAAEAGAPVSNMTSAYGGIRWASGMSRMFQYERTQSRIGDTLWNARDLYLENSPLFHADKIETPLLILHNDKDGAVPWYQGIELFVAMRRLSKPAWLINYNDEGHGLSQNQNQRDWSVRLQQFFDHYLKGEPAPKWLTKGVPATEKGKTLGLELEEN